MELRTIARLVAVGALGAVATACGAPQQPPSPNAVIGTYEDLLNSHEGDVVLYAPGTHPVSKKVNIRQGTSVGRTDTASPVIGHNTVDFIDNPAIVSGERADRPSEYGPASTSWACGQYSPEFLGMQINQLPMITGCLYLGTTTNSGVGEARGRCFVTRKENEYIQCADGTKVGKTSSGGAEPLPKSQAGMFKSK